ncbi:MAG: hypothetical protein ACRC6A_09310 [Fusobacteriaceae bacterium]
MEEFKQYLQVLGRKELFKKDYDSKEIYNPKSLEINLGLLREIEKVGIEWFGKFDGEVLQRKILITPTEKTKKDLRERGLQNQYAYVSFTVGGQKIRARDNDTGKELTIEEALELKKKRKLDLACPLCNARLFVNRGVNRENYKVVPFFRVANKKWCCRNKCNISVFKLGLAEEKEKKKDEYNPIYNRKGIKAKIGEELFIYESGSILTKKMEQTNKIAIYRDCALQNLEQTVETLKTKEIFLVTSGGYDELKCDGKIGSRKDIFDLAREHLLILKKQMEFIKNNLNKTNKHDKKIFINQFIYQYKVYLKLEKDPALNYLLKEVENRDEILKEVSEQVEFFIKQQY